MSEFPPGPLWMIGCGNMGSAMLSRWLVAGLDPAAVTIVTRTGRAAFAGVRALTALPADETPATLVLAFKPQQLDEVTPTLAHLAPRLLVSILAGVEVAALARRFPAAGAIVRAMPNLPVAIGQGVTALYGEADEEARAGAEALAAPLGHHEWIAEEAQFDAVTALAGCGPGFVFRFADALAGAGEALGLAPDQARRLALATLAGSAAMAADADVPPATLAARVASPGGSTRQGLDVLDADGALADLLRRTLAASARRNAEMAAAARGTATVSVASVPTRSASRYLQQLAKHWSHKMTVAYTAEEGTIDFPNGSRLAMRAEAETLDVTLTVPADGDAARMREVVSSHLDRFAFREAPLTFDWQAG